MKYVMHHSRRTVPPSLPVRGAWIEIGVEACVHAFIGVAPRKGSVD